MKKEKFAAHIIEVCSLCAAEEDTLKLLSISSLTEEEIKSGLVAEYMSEPCKSCERLMRKGFLLIGIDPSKSDDPENPWRSGHQWVIPHERAAQVFGTSPNNHAAFIDIDLAEEMGFPVFDLTPKGKA